MNYTQALNFIHSIPKFRRPLGNENLKKLLTHLGEPQKNLKFIHIAGTNGKGSTAAMTAKILQKSGYKTGLFTSPFIEVFNERIRINDEYISNDDLAVYTKRVKTAMEKYNAPVSEFAFITALAFLYFYEKKCDIVVLEVGMGGRLDATNIIENSLISVICKISLDHTQYLGNTIEEIASEKCGIIRKNGTVIAYPNVTTDKIVTDYAKSLNADLIIADKAIKTDKGFVYKGKEYPLSLHGSYQAQNGAVVIEIIKILRNKGFNISDSDINDGLKFTNWPARFEFISDNIVIDGGHNIDGITALKTSLDELNKDIILVMAMMEDKDYEDCIRKIAPIAKAVVATQLEIPRCLDANAIYNIVDSMNIPCFVNTNPNEAVYKALNLAQDGIVCVCGSLYLAGEIRKNFKKQ